MNEPYEVLLANIKRCWGVSFGSGRSRLETICPRLSIDEEKEPYSETPLMGGERRRNPKKYGSMNICIREHFSIPMNFCPG